jgi:hypothetical protein
MTGVPSKEESLAHRRHWALPCWQSLAAPIAKKVAVAPSPNELAPYTQPAYAPSRQPQPPARIPVTPVPLGGVSTADLDYVATHTPILTEEGYATWYTAPYAGANPPTARSSTTTP